MVGVVYSSSGCETPDMANRPFKRSWFEAARVGIYSASIMKVIMSNTRCHCYEELAKKWFNVSPKSFSREGDQLVIFSL